MASGYFRARGATLRSDRPEGVLAPLAEAVAQFLATADFGISDWCAAVQGGDCVLWFYDRTKGHPQRWCSMEVCGNRNKVTRFQDAADERNDRVCAACSPD